MIPPGASAPILDGKHHAAPSAFTPESLMREARRQRGLAAWAAPEVCVLDPDGDVVRHLAATGRAEPDRDWPCYHSTLHRFALGGRTLGIVGCAVGAPFAVLVAEQLFACGCRLVLSLTSSGRIAPLRAPPYFVLIERALRDEGTSYHYRPPAAFADADPGLVAAVAPALTGLGEPVERGATWTTDAPYRETEAAIAAAARRGILAVEMEAAALYAFARARGKPVLCFAHVTNRMGQAGDFEKGEHGGATASLALIAAAAEAGLPRARGDAPAAGRGLPD